jgi:hypothetical protein
MDGYIVVRKRCRRLKWCCTIGLLVLLLAAATGWLDWRTWERACREWRVGRQGLSALAY